MRNHRLLPLTVCLAVTLAGLAQAQNDVHLAAFGAVPNDGLDDTVALRNACASMTSNRSLIFEAGQYDLFMNGYPGQLAFNGLSDIELRGSDATLMLHGFDPALPERWQIDQLFGFSGCHGVTVKDLTIEMARAPFSCGTVQAVSGPAGDLVAQISFPAEFPITPSMHIASLLRHHSDGRPWGQDGDYYWGDVETLPPQPTFHVASGVLTLRLPSEVVLAQGDKVTLRHRNYGCNAFTAWDCRPGTPGGSAVTMENVRIFTIPGMGFYASGTEGVVLRAFQVFRTPWGNRLMSTTADATHFVLCTGTISMPAATTVFGPTILEGMGDDGVNVHGTYSRITSVTPVGSGALLQIGTAGSVNTNPRAVYEVGDEVAFFDSTALAPLGVATVTQTLTSSGQLTLNVSSAPGSGVVNQLITNRTRRPAVRIDGVTVADNRGRGFVIQTADVEIRNSLVERCTGSGIHIRCDATEFFEAGGTTDVLIADNILSEVNNGSVVGSPRYTRAAISIAADVGQGTALGASNVHRRIDIIGNTIRNTTRPAVHVGSASVTSIRLNLFDQVCTGANSSTPDELAHAVWVENTASTAVINNTLIHAPGGTMGFDSFNATGNVVRNNIGF